MIFWYIVTFSCVYAMPATWVQRINGNTPVDERDNSLLNYNEEFSDLDIYFQRNLTDDLNKTQNYTMKIIPFSTDFSNKNETSVQNSKSIPVIPSVATSLPKKPNLKNSKIDPIFQNNTINANESRIPRQEGVNSTTTEFSEENASQEESSEEEEDGNMITGLLSAFLGGLSRPDGSIDLEAITGLLGSLSTQNPDGTYDFNGLTELLRGFLGGGQDGGGSDIGAFTGGLLGAIIKGVANPPGPKGAGILTGKIVTGILPALSVPPPSGNATTPSKYPPPLDSGSFLTGLLKTVLNGGGNGTAQGGGRGQSKYTLFKLLFSLITGLFSTAASLSSKSDWN